MLVVGLVCALVVAGGIACRADAAGSGAKQPARAGEASKASSQETRETHEPPQEPPDGVPKIPTRFPQPQRVVALGDVHGDMQATLRALELTGLVDHTGHWMGGAGVLVQTGDQLDRGDDEQAILDLFEQLRAEASKAGGAVHVLNGNHEYMNVAGDLRYVTPGGFKDFEDVHGLRLADARLAQIPPHAKARAAAFLPGLAYARTLATRNTVVIVGDSAFVHGGILPKHARRIEQINQLGRAWLWGASPADVQKGLTELMAPDSVVWTRKYSEPELAPDACAVLAETLAILKVKRLVVGHTVQLGGITSACEQSVWRIDVGMARYYGGQPQALEIANGKVRILAIPSAGK